MGRFLSNLIATAVLLGAPSVFADRPATDDIEVSVGVLDFDFPPYQVVDETMISGPDIELIRAIFARMPGYRLQVELRPNIRAFSDLKASDVDVITQFDTPENRSLGLITDIPLHTSLFQLYTKTDSGVEINTLEDTYAHKIGVVMGGSVSQALSKAHRAGKLETHPTQSFQTLIKMLISERLQAAIINSDVADFYTEQMGFTDQIQPANFAISEPMHFHLFVNRSSTSLDPEALQQAINKAMKSMQADGSWAGIVQRWKLPMAFDGLVDLE